ncbi:MAG: MCE family protein, partial [Bacteroidales bacterium]|nr:MCE family protein [Bacteroidales bacterium]
YNLHGLEEQAAVYIRGHKVGQVDAIHYDFAKDSAFTVDISIRRDISLPAGTQMALVSDGLLGGMAIELAFPEYSAITNDQSPIEKGSFLSTTYVPGLMESLQGELLAHIDEAVQGVDSLVEALKGQVEGDHIKATLTNVDRISSDLTAASADLKKLMATQVPRIVNNADTAVANLNTIVSDVKSADLAATVARVDTAVDGVNALIADVRSEEGTIGQLLYNKSLYNHIDATVVSADSLIVDLKANPKRYVHFSLFGKKNK